MAVFPVFINLEGKKCVVVGGGSVASRKIDTLLRFNADITVVSPEISEKICRLNRDGRLRVAKKTYSKGDLEGAFMAIAATNSPAANDAVYRDAVERKLLVNVADCPEKCNFIFPSIVKKGDVVVGISTSGSCPALSKRIRQKIEAALPESCGRAAEVLKKCRERADREFKNVGVKKRLIEKIIDEIAFSNGYLSDEQIEIKVESIFEEFKNKNEKGN